MASHLEIDSIESPPKRRDIIITSITLKYYYIMQLPEIDSIERPLSGVMSSSPQLHKNIIKLLHL